MLNQENVDTGHGSEQPTSAKKATFKIGKTAVVETSKGTFKFVLYQKDMPGTTKNFIRLAGKGFYEGTIFHRYEPGFVIQGGQARKGEETPPNIEFERCNGLVHKLGAVGMARASEYDSANSQFYICLGPKPEIDGEYAIFGQVTSGIDVVKKLRKGDKILKVEIVKTAAK